MAEAPLDFATWLDRADIPRSRLTPQVLTLLQAVFSFRQRQGFDYFSTRLLSTAFRKSTGSSGAASPCTTRGDDYRRTYETLYSGG